MKKLVIIIGALLISSLSFANRQQNDELTNIISSYYSENAISLNNESISETKENSIKASVREEIINFAQKKLGSPYVWGATGPNSFDCSGFVGYVFKSVANLNLPRVSSEQATFKPRISSANMTKGDLVFFETTGKGRISHVGIYMGDRQFIHAASGKSKRVMVSSLDSSYYKKAFRWAINPFSQ